MSEDGVERDLKVTVDDPVDVIEHLEKNTEAVEKHVERRLKAKKRLAEGLAPIGGSAYGPNTSIPIEQRVTALNGLVAGIPAMQKIASSGTPRKGLPQGGGAPLDIRAHASSYDIYGRPITNDAEASRTLIGHTGGAPQDITVENLTKDPKKVKDQLAKIQQQIHDLSSFTSNPIQWAKNKVADKLSKYPKIANLMRIGGVATLGIGFGIEVAHQIADAIIDQFGPGGLWDVRKLTLNNVKTIAPLDTLIKIRDGQVFFTADAGQKLRQGAPELSNTRALRQGHLRYIQLYQGT